MAIAPPSTNFAGPTTLPAVQPSFEIRSEWAHLSYAESSSVREVYGFAGSQGAVNLEGIRFVPEGKPSRVLLICMHPASTLQLLPMPRAMARRGLHVLCAASRFARNDTPLILLQYVGCVAEPEIVDVVAYPSIRTLTQRTVQLRRNRVKGVDCGQTLIAQKFDEVGDGLWIECDGVRRHGWRVLGHHHDSR